MERFARLMEALDGATCLAEKLGALEHYFREAAPSDAAWALWFLQGESAKRAVKIARLREWAAEVAELPEWLLDECFKVVGDWAETLALALSGGRQPERRSLAEFVHQRILPLNGACAEVQRRLVEQTWSELDARQCLVWHRLITGRAVCSGCSQLLVRALARVADVDPASMALRLAEPWQPSPDSFARLMSKDTTQEVLLHPYPFRSARPWKGGGDLAGGWDAWQVEWKWNGLRAQLVRRGVRVALWSRRGEVLTKDFPEVVEWGADLPEGTVLEGELLELHGERAPAPLWLPRRVGRQKTRSTIQGQASAVFLVSDLHESGGLDWRGRPLRARREELERVMAQVAEERNRPPLKPAGTEWLQGDLFAKTVIRSQPIELVRLSPLLEVRGWEELEAKRREARERGASGLVFRRLDSLSGVGCQVGTWWEWEADPWSCRAVLVAVQTGQGQGGMVLSRYTLAVWDGPKLVPVATVHPGLAGEQAQAVEAFVHQNTTGRFGPVRAVRPALVFELAFDAVSPSPRNRPRLILQRARLNSWRRDLQPADADHLAALKAIADAVDAEPTLPRPEPRCGSP